MRTLDVDDEVYALIDDQALKSSTSHNQALRQLLRLSTSVAAVHRDTPADANPATAKTPPPAPRQPAKGGKAPKANLADLEDRGFIRSGERVVLIDYHGDRIPGYEATVAGNQLVWQGRPGSMSKLARQGLQSVGFTTKSVRGPKHWVLEQGGERIADMWARALKEEPWWAGVEARSS